MFSAFMCTKFTIWQIPSKCWISKYMNITCVSIKKKGFLEIVENLFKISCKTLTIMLTLVL